MRYSMKIKYYVIEVRRENINIRPNSVFVYFYIVEFL